MRGAQWLDMCHDGYRSLYGIIHRRRLWLSPDGGDLRGEDAFLGYDGRLITVPDQRFIVRFHLHPTGQGDPGAKRPGGADAACRAVVDGGCVRRAPASASPRASILAKKAACAAPNRSCLVGQVPVEGTTIKWALTRMEGRLSPAGPPTRTSCEVAAERVAIFETSRGAALVGGCGELSRSSGLRSPTSCKPRPESAPPCARALFGAVAQDAIDVAGVLHQPLHLRADRAELGDGQARSAPP